MLLILHVHEHKNSMGIRKSNKRHSGRKESRERGNERMIK